MLLHFMIWTSFKAQTAVLQRKLVHMNPSSFLAFWHLAQSTQRSLVAHYEST